MNKHKLTFLGILFSLFSFGMMGQTSIKNFKVTAKIGETFSFNDGGKKFTYNFDIKGNYGYGEIKLSLYANSVNYSNLLGLIRWNREGDDKLNFDDYETKNMWVNVGVSWIDKKHTVRRSNKYILVAENNGVSKTYTYYIPSTVYWAVYRGPNADKAIEDTCNSVSKQQELVNVTSPLEIGQLYRINKKIIWDGPDQYVNGYFEIKSRKDTPTSNLNRLPRRTSSLLTFNCNAKKPFPFSNPDPNGPQYLRPYSFSVHTLSGEVKEQRMVTDPKEEQQILETLEKGFYIIKSGDKTYKIVK